MGEPESAMPGDAMAPLDQPHTGDGAPHELMPRTGSGGVEGHGTPPAPQGSSGPAGDAELQDSSTQQETVASDSSVAAASPDAAGRGVAEQQEAAAQPSESEGVVDAAAADKQHTVPAPDEAMQQASEDQHNTGRTAATAVHVQQEAGAAEAQQEAAADDAEPPPGKPSHSAVSKAATSRPNKETAVERLTTPTAMRMLKQLQQTQGGKQVWHIATGVAYQGKKLSSDELSNMVDRLAQPKHDSDNLPAKPHAVKLVFEGNKETLVPVKETTKEDNIAYMSHLYERCQETRAKTMQSLQNKWLQPLSPKPKQQATK